MLWRSTPAEFKQGKGDGNRRSMLRLARTKQAPGILAYAGETPIGWCAIAPRSAYPALARSRNLKPIDDQLVWSVSCFFINQDYRRQGVSVKLLETAVDYAKSCGASVVEGYPVDPPDQEYPAVFAWTGTLGTFLAAQFEECPRRSNTRPIMRRWLQQDTGR